ncbi:MAG: PASTA domain-containing protein, partial [Gaiellaceae bacterium]
GPPKRRRPIWPWILAVVLLAVAGVAAFFAYEKIQDELTANKPVGVPYVLGMQKDLAVKQVQKFHLKPVVTYGSSTDTAKGRVFNQNPDAGQRIPRGDPVKIYVSTGVPKTPVPDVVDKSSDDAVAALTAAHLKFRIVQVFSGKPTGTVTGQDPQANTQVPEGTSVRINVSKGVQQVPVPNVVGQPYANARGALLGAGFQVKRMDVDSSQPLGIVVSTTPGFGASAPKGSTVTVNVSKGQTSAPVPDVTGQTEGDAKTLLQQQGFKVKTVHQATSDPGSNGVVLNQNPSGGSNAPQGSTVTIFVGQFSGTTT